IIRPDAFAPVASILPGHPAFDTARPSNVEIEDLLLPPVTAFMLRYAPSLVPQFDCAGVRFRLHLSASRQRERVHVGEHLGTTQPVHPRETRLRYVESL